MSLRKEFSRDQQCEIEIVFVRSELHVEKHMGELGMKCGQWGHLGLLTWGQFSGLSLPNQLEVLAGGWLQLLSLGLVCPPPQQQKTSLC